MALYVSAARRRRRTIVVGVVALVVGLLVGWLIGRSTGSSANDEVKARQTDAEQLVARLDGLDLEYQTTATGGAGSSDALTGSLDAAKAIAADADALLGRMPWVAQAERTTTVGLVDAVRQAVELGASPAEVTAAVAKADQALRAAAGIDQPGA
jgi:hypothetical protein